MRKGYTAALLVIAALLILCMWGCAPKAAQPEGAGAPPIPAEGAASAEQPDAGASERQAAAPGPLPVPEPADAPKPAPEPEEGPDEEPEPEPAAEEKPEEAPEPDMEDGPEEAPEPPAPEPEEEPDEEPEPEPAAEEKPEKAPEPDIADGPEEAPDPPAPEPEEEPGEKPEPVPAQEPEPEPPAAPRQSEYERSVGNVGVSEDVFEKDKQVILGIIDNLATIMRNRDYRSWITYLDDASISYWSRRQNLQKAASRLPVKGVRLNGMEDYFRMVFIPSRQGRTVDEIRYETPTQVKVVHVTSDADVVYYTFRKVNGKWKLHLPTISD